MQIKVFESFWHIIISFILFLFGLALVYLLSKRLKTNIRISLFLYAWHTLFAIVYMFVTLSIGGDSLGYYSAALNGDIELQFGTRLVEYLSFLVVNLLDLSYLGLFLFFNIIGSAGLILFYSSLSSITKNHGSLIYNLMLICVFLPSLSFWTSAIGKDSIAFLSVALAIHSYKRDNINFITFLIAGILMLIVRPHISAFMIFSMLISLFISKNRGSLKMRLMLLIFFLPLLFLLVSFVLNSLGIEEALNLESTYEYIETRQGLNQGFAGSIDIENLPFLLKIYTYLFRPLPFESHNLFSLLASFDNLFLLVFFLFGALKMFRSKKILLNNSFFWLFSISVTSLLSLTTSNLGIAVRQKWMVMPFFIILFFLSSTNLKTNSRKKSEAIHV